MRYKVTSIRDLMSVLKDIVPLIKDPEFLYVGREFPSFRQRPREVLANLLICIAQNFESGSNLWTFSTDPTGGDGVIVNRSTLQGFPTEHVFVPKHKASQSETIEGLITNAVRHKHRKGRAYAEGKQLVIFVDVPGGPWLPNRVGPRIEGQHKFGPVWVVGLELSDGANYAYSVVLFDAPNCYVWKVIIDLESLGWRVERLQ